MGEPDRPSTADFAERSERTVGAVTRLFSVSSRTLRFYEDRGLLQPRREGTSRFYDDADIARLGLILRGKSLGWTLSEIHALIARHSGDELVPLSPLFEKITQMARETFGSDEKARRWLHRPTTALSGLSPLDVSSEGQSGAQKVVDLLKRIDHGLSV